ncbi:hypothetical protein QEN19_001987 [Hanseniaspora menglaensis]
MFGSNKLIKIEGISKEDIHAEKQTKKLNKIITRKDLEMNFLKKSFLFTLLFFLKVAVQHVSASPNKAPFVCSVIDKSTKNIVFNHTIPSFMVNDSICDCCDCSDEADGNKKNFCDELLAEYNLVLVDGYINNSLSKGKQILYEMIFEDDNEFKTINDDLNEKKTLLAQDKFNSKDFEFVQSMKTAINSFWDNIKSLSETFHDDENIAHLNQFFDKELFIIMNNDRSTVSDSFIKRQELFDLKKLISKYNVIKMLISINEDEYGLRFGQAENVTKLDVIIEKYGRIYYNGDSFLNKFKFLIGIDTATASYAEKLTLQTELADLETKLEKKIGSYSELDIKSRLSDYFQTKFKDQMTFKFGKFEYILTPDKKLYQSPLTDTDNNIYFIGALRTMTFTEKNLENSDDMAKRKQQNMDVIWKKIQQERTNYLHNAIPDIDTPLFDKIQDMHNGLEMEFIGGSKCWDGPRRSAEIRVQCSDSLFEVLEVQEPSKCWYVFEVASIFGCI